MSDGVPKSRVTLTYDTRQPEGREKPRELPFRLLVLGDVGGEKGVPLDARRVRQLNGRNLGEVVMSLKIKVPDVELDDKRKLSLLIDSVSSFSPDDVLRVLTGQKAATTVDAAFKETWGADADPKKMWPGDAALTATWAQRENVIGFQKSYQNSKTLRAALKAFSTPPADQTQTDSRKKAIEDLKKQLAARPANGGTH